MTSRYWLVQIDWEYIVDDDGNMTTKKTKAGRLRYNDLQKMRDELNAHGITSVDFVPTTYKPGDTEFINPTLWSWMHKQQDYR